MKFQVTLTPSSEGDLQFFKATEQRLIVSGIRAHLTADANIESKRRKQLRPNPIAPWELRIGIFRIFYVLEEIPEAPTVKVVAIGYKQHNDLFIRRKKVEL